MSNKRKAQTKMRGSRLELVAVNEVHALPEPTERTVHLAYCHGAPDQHSGSMLLIDDSGDTPVEVVRYRCTRMFVRVERHGAWWRLQGQDRATGDCIYTKEVTE